MIELRTNLRFVLPNILSFHPADIKVNVSTDWGISPQFFVQNLFLQRPGDTIMHLEKGTCLGYLQLENITGSLVGL